jgi:site-specific recombinase XerD
MISESASGGMSLPMIGRLLGHTRVQTTQRYPPLR